MAMATRDDWQSGKTLAESTGFMFENDLATDVTFKFPSSDKTVKAHRIILMARSHVFYTMFSSGLDKPGESIEIPDIEPAIFKEFLRYLYLDDTKLTPTKALQLTYCAEKYEVKALKAQCMGFLQRQVNEATWAEILDHAVFYNQESLTQACLHFLRSMKSLEMAELEEYQISRETLEVILDYEELSVREVDIFKFCQTWGERECKKKEVPVNMANKRKMLGPLLRKIPFCSMKQEEFVAEVSGQHFLNGQEELQILRYLCGADKANPPFPCLRREVKDGQVSVKLPDVWDKGMFEFYHFSIRCSQSFTLIGLKFTCRGKFSIRFGSICEVMDVRQGSLTVYLKEAVHCEVGTMLDIQKKYEEGYSLPRHMNIDFPFSPEVNALDSGLYKKLDFVITKYSDYFGKPPFDTLIVRL